MPNYDLFKCFGFYCVSLWRSDVSFDAQCMWYHQLRARRALTMFKMFCWEPEGHHCCTKSIAIAPFLFSMQHCWTVIIPFWFSTDEIMLWVFAHIASSVPKYSKSLIWSKMRFSFYPTKVVTTLKILKWIWNSSKQMYI